MKSGLESHSCPAVFPPNPEETLDVGPAEVMSGSQKKHEEKARPLSTDLVGKACPVFTPGQGLSVSLEEGQSQRQPGRADSRREGCLSL